MIQKLLPKFFCESSLTTIGLSLLTIFFIGCKKDFSTNTVTSALDIEKKALPTEKPNILFIVGDDIGYEILSCNGGQSFETPNLDNLAKNGIRFTQAHASPMCSPSRVVLLTGKYNFRNYTQFGYLDITEKTIGNMFANNAYATCYAGKWQLDGGAASINAFGWQRYSAWLPFLLGDGVDAESLEGPRYKSARIYQDGGYLPPSASRNKYSDDIFTAYLEKFIDSVRLQDKPFFAYYSMILAHPPFCPTPDDPEYSTWDYANFKSNTRFFPSMVKYMDKKVGELLSFLSRRKLLQNTVIIFVGDNGTSSNIISAYSGMTVQGGKGATSETGTNVSMLVSGPGRFVKNKTSKQIVDFTDFMPTLADIAGLPLPAESGILDGKSFFPVLTNQDSSTLRTTIFNSYVLEPYKNNMPWTRWVQNDCYKLYDTNRIRKNYELLKIEKCKPDSLPLSTLTPEEDSLKKSFIEILRSYVP